MKSVRIITCLFWLTALINTSTMLRSVFTIDSGNSSSIEVNHLSSNMICLYYEPTLGKVIQLFQLHSASDYAVAVEDFKLPGTQDVVKATLFFNYCTMSGIIPSNCNGTKLAYGYVLTDKIEGQESQCFPIYGYKDKGINSTIKATKSGDDSIPEVDYIEFKMTSPKEQTLFNETDLTLHCQTSNNTQNTSAKLVNGTLVVQQWSKIACGNDVSGVLSYFAGNRVFAIILGIIGVFLTYFGIKFLNYTLPLVGFTVGVVSTVLLVIIFAGFISWNTTNVIIVGGASIVVGAIFAAIAYFIPLIAVAICGISGGAWLGSLICMLLAVIPKVIVNPVLFYIVVGTCSFISLIVACKYRYHLIILATVFGGSNLVIFGIENFFSNYPDFTTYADMIRDKQPITISGVMIGYLAGFSLLVVSGVYVQWTFFLKKKEELNHQEGFYFNQPYYSNCNEFAKPVIGDTYY